MKDHTHQDRHQPWWWLWWWFALFPITIKRWWNENHSMLLYQCFYWILDIWPQQTCFKGFGKWLTCNWFCPKHLLLCFDVFVDLHYLKRRLHKPMSGKTTHQIFKHWTLNSSLLEWTLWHGNCYSEPFASHFWLLMLGSFFGAWETFLESYPKVYRSCLDST